MWVGKLLNGIKSMYVDSLACVRVKWGESKNLRIESGVRQGCVMSPWLFSIYMEGDGRVYRSSRFDCRIEVQDLYGWNEFKYLGYVLDESGADVVECHGKVTSGRKVVGAIMSLVNARGERVLPVPVLLYVSETIIEREKNRYRIMNNHNERG